MAKDLPPAQDKAVVPDTSNYEQKEQKEVHQKNEGEIMTGQEAIQQLVDYTKDVCERLDIDFNARGRRNYYRKWADRRGPTGFIKHFTASNAAVTPRRKLGRIPVLLRRFARNSGAPGVHFVTWDVLMPEFADLRAKYEVFEHLTCEVFCWGVDVAFYHGNTANKWALGIEHRNIGKLHQRDDGSFGWGKKGKHDYVGRDPVHVRGFWCEPFTLGQIMADVLLSRWCVEFLPLEMPRFTGHENITSNRTDPSPHFPLKLVRDLAFNDDPLALLSAGYRADDDFFNRYDEWIEDDLDDLVVDDEPDAWFGREGDVEDCEFEDDEGLYGEDEEVTEGDVVEAKKALIQLGYWPLAGGSGMLTPERTPEFIWSLKLFQQRWVRHKHKKWIHYIKTTGIVDAPTSKMLNRMLRQRRFID
jgi:hypothetical protein